MVVPWCRRGVLPAFLARPGGAGRYRCCVAAWWPARRAASAVVAFRFFVVASRCWRAWWRPDAALAALASVVRCRRPGLASSWPAWLARLVELAGLVRRASSMLRSAWWPARCAGAAAGRCWRRWPVLVALVERGSASRKLRQLAGFGVTCCRILVAYSHHIIRIALANANNVVLGGQNARRLRGA